VEVDRRLAQAQDRPTDANDALYQFESSRDYNPAPNLEKIAARVLAINSADDERNPPELALIEQAMKRLKSGQYILLPVTNRSRGHGTAGTAVLWEQFLADLLSKTQPAK
jgi:homoserine O-acetyltransferase